MSLLTVLRRLRTVLINRPVAYMLPLGWQCGHIHSISFITVNGAIVNKGGHITVPPCIYTPIVKTAAFQCIK